MRGAPFISQLRTGLILSVLLHAGICIVAVSLPVNIDPAAAQPRAGIANGSTFTFDPSDPLQTPPPTPADKSLTALLVPPEPPLQPLTPEEFERKLTFGIDDSTQKTPNWMGVANPTEHKAPLATVNQPQLDPNPGSPGAPTVAGVSQNGPEVPLQPNTMPADTVAQPVDAPNPTDVRPPHEGDANADPSKPTADKPRTGGPEGTDRTDTARPRDGELSASGEKLSQPQRGPADLSHPNPNLPGPRAEDRGHSGELMTVRPDDTKPEAPKKIEPIRAASLPQQILPHPQIPTVPTPGAAASATPTAPMPAGAQSVSAAPGRAGERPGDKSPKEADASSTTPTIEIRPGQPAAAQGLNITTKRPNFTKLVRVTAFPQNPLFKVTFNALGIVTNVVLVESSGVPDVDGPVKNSLYQWTASGKILAEISSGDPDVGVTVSIRILLR